MDCFGASLCAAAYLENREEGQGLGGRHFTQGGRPAVVIGGTFRPWRAPEDALQGRGIYFRLKTKINPFVFRNYFCILISLSQNPI